MGPTGPTGPSGGGGGGSSADAAWYSGKRWYALGTSITAENSYTGKIQSLSGMVMTNRGVGGASLSTASNGNIWTQLINNVGTDAEVITIETINDFRLNVPLGAVTDAENPATSYFGALRSACNWILTNRPAARAFLFTAYGDAYVGGYPNGETANSFGKHYWEYNNAMMLVGRIYGIPVIDVGGESGINFHTCQYYTNDMIHMNALGATRYGEYAFAKMCTGLSWQTSRPTAPGAAAPVSVTGVDINQGSATALAPGDTLQLNATIAPSNASNKGMTWSTSAASKVTVSSDGLITAVAAGSANITVTTADGGFTDVIAVTVATAAVTGVSVAPTAVTLLPTQTQQLTATVLPSNAGNKSVNWSTSAASKATVNSTGLVTAVAVGAASITATTVENGFVASATITVASSIPVTSVDLTPAAASVSMGSTVQLTATVLPANATDKAVTYASSNPAVATVNSTGLVTGVSAGATNITVTTVDGGKTDITAITGLASDWNLRKASAYTGLGVAGIGADGSNDPTWGSNTWQYGAIFFNDYNSGDNACEFVCTGVPGDAAWIAVGSDGSSKFSAIGDIKNGISSEGIGTSGGFSMGTAGPYTINSTPLGSLIDVKFRMARVNDVLMMWKWNGSAFAKVLEANLATEGTKLKTDPTAWSTKAVGLMTGPSYTKVKNVYTGTYLSSGNIALTGISTSPTLNVQAGGTASVITTFTPTNATNKALNWSSDTPGVATVNAAGTVTGVAQGSAVVTATSVDGNFTDTTAVTVTPAAVSAWVLNPQTTFRENNLNGVTASGSNPSWASIGGTYGAIIINSPGDNAIEWEVENGSIGMWCVSGTSNTDGTFAGFGDMNGAITHSGAFTGGTIQTISGITPGSVTSGYATGKVYRLGRVGNRVILVRVDPGPTLVTIWDGDISHANNMGPANAALYANLDLGIMAGGGYSKPINCKTGTWTP